MTCLISNASLQPPVYDVYTALLIRVIPNQHFKSTLLGGGGGHKKEYAVYARENDDNYGRPLNMMPFKTKLKVVLYNTAHKLISKLKSRYGRGIPGNLF